MGAAIAASPLIRKIGLPITRWITNVYDTLGRLADTSLRSGTNVVLNQHQSQYAGHLRSKRTRTDGSCQDYTHDGGGNITALVAANQTLSATYKYDPYGRSVSTSGSMAAANTQRFSSKEIIPSTGFYYYCYRFYDPEHQRWLNRDPIEEAGGINLYTFVENDPINMWDSFGERGTARPPYRNPWFPSPRGRQLPIGPADYLRPIRPPGSPPILHNPPRAPQPPGTPSRNCWRFRPITRDEFNPTWPPVVSPLPADVEQCKDRCYNEHQDHSTDYCRTLPNANQRRRCYEQAFAALEICNKKLRKIWHSIPQAWASLSLADA